MDPNMTLLLDLCPLSRNGGCKSCAVGWLAGSDDGEDPAWKRTHWQRGGRDPPTYTNHTIQNSSSSSPFPSPPLFPPFLLSVLGRGRPPAA